jgi:hypothetical protein
MRTHLQRVHQAAYANFKTLCTRLESYLKGRGLLFTDERCAPTELEVAVMFSNCKSVLEKLHREGVRAEPSTSGSLRTFDLTIATLVKHVRGTSLEEMEQMGKDDTSSPPIQSADDGGTGGLPVVVTVGSDDPVVATAAAIAGIKRKKADDRRRKKTVQRAAQRKRNKVAAAKEAAAKEAAATAAAGGQAAGGADQSEGGEGHGFFHWSGR